MSKKDKRRKRRKLSKLLKKATYPKSRVPIAPPTQKFKSKKDYNRQKLKLELSKNVQ